MTRYDPPHDQVTNLTLNIRNQGGTEEEPRLKGAFSPVIIDNTETTYLVCEMNNFRPHHEPVDLDIAQAERIVACVNAFKGVPLEKIGEYAERIRRVERFFESINKKEGTTT